MSDEQRTPKRSAKKPVPQRITQLFADLETAAVEPQVTAPTAMPLQAEAAPLKAEPAPKLPASKRRVVERKTAEPPLPEIQAGWQAAGEPVAGKPAVGAPATAEPTTIGLPPTIALPPEAVLQPPVLPPMGALAVKAGDLEDHILPATQPLTPMAEESLRKGRPVVKSAQVDQPAMLAYALPHGRYPRAGLERGPTRTQEDEETKPQTAQSLILEILDEDPLRTWSDDELQLVEQVTDQLSLALENARLFQSTQTALSETETLYQASAELNAARTYEDILQTLRKYTILGQADASLSLSLFNRPLGVNGGEGSANSGARGGATGEAVEETAGSGETAEWITEVASWGAQSTGQLGQRQALQRVPVARLLSPTEPVLVEDLLNDPRIDGDFRAGTSAKSLFLAPLTVGGLWIGFIQSAFRLPTRIVEQEVRRLMVLAGQAAIAIQNLRLLEESQRRASCKPRPKSPGIPRAPWRWTPC